MSIRLSAIALACLIGASFSTAADPRFEQGARFEAKGEFDKALGEYRSILAEDPKNSEAYFAAAEVRVKMKDYSGALANYRLAYKFTPTMSVAYEGAAKVYEALGQKSKAEAELAKDPKNKPAEEVVEATATPVETAAPVDAEPKAMAKEEPVKEEPKAESVAKAETAPKAAPAETAAPVDTAPKAVEAAPKTVEAVKAEETPKEVAAKPEPVVDEDPFEKGKALFAEGKFKEAAPLWREVLAKKPGDAGAYFYAGLTRFELGEMDKAEFNLKKGITYAERGNDANYYLALVYQKTNRAELEKKSLAAYLKKAAPNAEFRQVAESRFAELTAPAQTAKDSVPAVEGKADSEPVKTASDVQENPVAMPQSAPVEQKVESENSIANANLLLKAGSLEAALQMYKSLLDSNVSPDARYFAMLQMGNIYREMRDFHSAVTRYREIVQQFPESDWATEAERALEDAVWLEKHSRELPSRKR